MDQTQATLSGALVIGITVTIAAATVPRDVVVTIAISHPTASASGSAVIRIRAADIF